MFKPSVGELLLGITESLRETVLPKVDDAAAKRQLKAALHGLGRLQRSWDLWPTCLAEDNDDLAHTLGDCIQRLMQSASDASGDLSAMRRQLAAQGEETRIAGINDPALLAAAQRNLHLQTLAAKFEQWLDGAGAARGADISAERRTLRELHRRRTERTLRANSDMGDPE